MGTFGPTKACMKVLRVGDSHFINEANILSSCCHTNIIYLFGVCLLHRHKIIVLSFHGINNESFSLHSVLISKRKLLQFDVTTHQWNAVLLGLISGLEYIHCKCIIHNDIKEDNVVLELDPDNQIKAVLIDFGKACLEKFGKMYTLSSKDIELYKCKHPHIAPDLRNGLCTQDQRSDFFSFGRVLSILCDHVLTSALLSSLAQQCLNFNAFDCPTTKDIKTSITNLLM